MSNKKISQLTEMTSLSGNDLVMVAENNGDATYTSKKIQVSNFKGEWQLIERKTFLAAATSYTFSGLNGDVDRRYKIVTRHFYTAGSDCTLYLTCNSDTGQNYPNQTHIASNTTVSVSRITTQAGLSVSISSSSNPSFGELYIDAHTGMERAMKSYFIISRYTQYNQTCGWTDTAANITQLVVTASLSNGIGIGSYIELWKLAQ